VDNAAKEEAVVMLEIYVDDSADPLKEWQNILFENMEYSLHELQNGHVSAGRLYPKLEDIQLSLWEAKEAYAIGRVLWEDRYCFIYSLLSAYSAMYHTDSSKIDLSYMEILNEYTLGSFDGISALEAYIEYNGYKKAAEKLRVHENTMRYHIEKIEKFLHLDIHDHAVAHSLITQIKLWRLRKAQTQGKDGWSKSRANDCPNCGTCSCNL